MDLQADCDGVIVTRQPQGRVWIHGIEHQYDKQFIVRTATATLNIPISSLPLLIRELTEAMNAPDPHYGDYEAKGVR